MPVAFVITQTEEDIVNAISEGSPKPHMDGSLFKFRGVDVKPFLERLGEFMNNNIVEGTEEYRAALRLCERLGHWIGVQIAESKDDAQMELPLDIPDVDDVPQRQRRKRSVV